MLDFMKEILSEDLQRCSRHDRGGTKGERQSRGSGESVEVPHHLTDYLRKKFQKEITG